MNFFISSDSYKDYTEKQSTIHKLVEERFHNNICLNIIAQPPVTSKVILEAFFYDMDSWSQEMISHKSGKAAYFRRDKTEFMIGSVQVFNKDACKDQSGQAFMALQDMLYEKRFSLQSIIRQWNYIKGITAFNGSRQHYQDFNDVRTRYYGDVFTETGYPAATGIGMTEGGVIIEFVAMKSDEALTLAVNNPDQVPAHNYSKNVLVGDNPEKTSPKFERARYLNLKGRQMIFISGTASIIGEQIEGMEDPEKQTEVTIHNIQQLYSGDVLAKICTGNVSPNYGHARVYLKNKEDYKSIKQVFERYYGRLPVVYIQADICREGLLMEIEGEVILK